MKKRIVKSGVLTLALGAGLTAAAQAQPPAEVYLNGKPLQTSMAPLNQNGRLLVPLRDIFEALGARVDFSDLTQTIAAQRGTTTVKMALGSRDAEVNSQHVVLDVPATAYYGHTMVPLRFVSEAMGAHVDYNGGNNVVSIDSGTVVAGNPGHHWRDHGNGGPGGSQTGGYRQISIPANTVVPVTMDQTLSSRDAYVGQTFTGSVQTARPGDSEFPAGTKLEGTVTEVSRMDRDSPGILDVAFQTAIFPDGTRVPLHGSLISLDSNNVNNQSGRVVAKTAKRPNDTLKIVGIGAGAGFVLGKVLKKNGAVPTILGALGGLIYDKTQNNKVRTSEAVIGANTRIGVRLDSAVRYTDTTNYYEQRSGYIRM